MLNFEIYKKYRLRKDFSNQKHVKHFGLQKYVFKFAGTTFCDFHITYPDLHSQQPDLARSIPDLDKLTILSNMKI